MSVRETVSIASRLRAFLRGALGRRIFWLTDERRDLSGTPSSSRGIAVVLGREHYTERRKKFPNLSRRDLDAVLKQELAGSRPCVLAVTRPDDERREVVFFELHDGVLDRAGRAPWLVPESVLVASTLSGGGVACVDRDGFRYFVGSSGVSQAAGGAIGSVELFSLAAGLDGSESPVTLDRGAVEDLLLPSLRRLPADMWRRLRTPGHATRWEVDWWPLARVAAVGLVAYLGVASGYLFLTQNAREKELSALGTEVETLLKAQAQVETLEREHAGVAKVESQWVDTYRLWQAVAAAWGKGALVSEIEFKDTEFTIRGSAQLATDVLAAVAAIPGVKNAKFSAPVRGGRSGLEEFSITATLGAEGADG